jgi:hypothetical protein
MSGLTRMKWTFAVNALIVGATLLAMSGACSQHEPGPYEGGGRGTTQPLPNGVTDSAPPEDTFVPPDNFVKDVVTLPESG